MPRLPRDLGSGYCYHVTIRCNNREFRLTRRECRQLLLYAISKAQKKYEFKLYGLCIMSNHVHYLIKPKQAEELPKIMHWLNWYTAMCFNRMLNRTGHFWEKRYHSTGFCESDTRRALNTIRYIHGNPKAAGIQHYFFYDFSNYGSYDRLTDDGLTEWHPAFLKLGQTLQECAEKYRQFCQKYKPKSKPEKKYHWGKKMLVNFKIRGKKKTSPGQMRLAWEGWELENHPEILAVADKFVQANCFNPNYKRWVPGMGFGKG